MSFVFNIHCISTTYFSNISGSPRIDMSLLDTWLLNMETVMFCRAIRTFMETSWPHMRRLYHKSDA